MYFSLFVGILCLDLFCYVPDASDYLFSFIVRLFDLIVFSMIIHSIS